MSQGMLSGLALFATGVIMFVVGLPRHGEVVGFLRNRDRTQALYMMAIILLLALGGTVTLSNL